MTPKPLTSLLAPSSGSGSLTVGTYLEEVRKTHERVLDLVELVTKLVKRYPHLQEHRKYLMEVATKLVILEGEAVEKFD